MLIVGDKNFESYQKGIEAAQMLMNKEKTFASKNFFEFAKRFFKNGHEVSPFPVGAVLSAGGDINSLTVVIDNAIAKS